MEINNEQYTKMKQLLPVQRGNVSVDNITFINALLYICESGCKWRRLPKEYGNWHVIYKRFHRWVKDGIIEKLFRELHVQGIMEETGLKRLMDSMTVLVQQLYFTPVVPPKKNRKDHWDYDKELYQQRNEIERLFRLIQGFRRVFCRFDKLDVMYSGFVMLALVFISLE